jgi:hypothetical protein
VDPETREMFREAEQAVSRLVEGCRKRGPLYVQSPRPVAQGSRT